MDDRIIKILCFIFRYDEQLQERLRRRREKLANGETVEDLDAEDFPEEEETGSSDAKSVLQDLQQRY